jgi:hypothetical protein
MSPEEKLRRLQRAIDLAGTHRLSDVVERIKDSRAQLWELRDGCVITELHNFPLYKAVQYWLISGDLKDCLALEDTINSWAIEQGCTRATACGRRGWGRVAAPTGWREWYPNFQKPLGGADGHQGR